MAVNKVVLLGESSVGKTALVTRLSKNIFEPTLDTIGAHFTLLKLDHNRFDIWDTAGQERFDSLAPLYYRDASIILIIFDLAELTTFNTVIKFITKIKQENPPAKIIIIGNKLDLVQKDLNVIQQQINKLIETNPVLHQLNSTELQIIYLSAKTGFNLDSVRQRLTLYASLQIPHNPSLNIIQERNNYCLC